MTEEREPSNALARGFACTERASGSIYPGGVDTNLGAIMNLAPPRSRVKAGDSDEPRALGDEPRRELERLLVSSLRACDQVAAHCILPTSRFSRPLIPVTDIDAVPSWALARRLGGKAAWQTEVGQHTRLEPRESGDSLAGERHDEKPDRPEDAVAVIADVDAEGRLAARAGGNEAPGAPPSLSQGLCHGVQAAILERERRHREAHILGEHGDKNADVAPLERSREAFEDLLFL